MSDFFYVAVLTYGSEKQHGVSCFKIGSGSGADVLLALFGDRAKEVALPKASYRYVHVDVKGFRTHRNYLVLRVTSDEKAQIESICRKNGSFVWVYLWEHEERHWLQFPNTPAARYIDPTSYGGACPKFLPSHAGFVTPSSLNDEQEPEDAKGITLKQSGDWWWIAGDTYAHRETLRSAGAKWSKSRREWYYKGADLPQAIRDLAAVNESKPVSTAPEAEQVVTSDRTRLAVVKHNVPPSTLAPSHDFPPSPAVAAPVIPIAAASAPAKPDNVQFAIQRMKDAPQVVTTAQTVKHDTCGIAQEFVGEPTGSITGNVHCYGYAVDLGICVYLNFGGPRVAIEAIRAKLSKGDIVTCASYDHPAVELTPGEGNTGKYHDYMQNIPEARYTSVILLHEQITTPNYGGKSRTCIIRTGEAHGVAMLKHHITQLVAVPVFDTWADYLWDAGALASLVVRPLRAGGIDLWSVELDADAWTRLICGGLREGVIHFPNAS